LDKRKLRVGDFQSRLKLRFETGCAVRGFRWVAWVSAQAQLQRSFPVPAHEVVMAVAPHSIRAVLAFSAQTTAESRTDWLPKAKEKVRVRHWEHEEGGTQWI